LVGQISHGENVVHNCSTSKLHKDTFRIRQSQQNALYLVLEFHSAQLVIEQVF